MAIGVTVVRFSLDSVAPYSASGPFQSPKNSGEKDNDYEERVWRERMHTNESGNVVIPAMAFKFAITESARRFLGKIPGRRNATWTKLFEAGLLITEDVDTGIKAATVPGVKFYVSANGKRGVGTRVWRTFPMVMKWGGLLTVNVLDPTITEDYEAKRKKNATDSSALFEAVREAGRFIGVGRFRAEVGGLNGRFGVKIA